ncbi:MAG: hypothetical protein H7841_08045 [Magnetospirillum sp. WYHS-4]
MTDTAAIPTREVVGLFADRQSFESAVNALLEVGFERADLSVLGSHESLDAAGKPGKPWGDVLTALVGEIKFEVPLVASGAIFLFGGPFAATIAGVVGAATAGMALKEVVGEVTSTPHTDDFARALTAGSVILWVSAETPEREHTAIGLLTAHGGANVHLHEHA